MRSLEIEFGLGMAIRIRNFEGFGLQTRIVNFFVSLSVFVWLLCSLLDGTAFETPILKHN